jgi:hypothetical protein
MALIGVSLLFMTKISAASMELLLFGLLLVTYYRIDKKIELQKNIELKKKIYIFGIVGVYLLLFTLLRVYLPIENTFHMVNSSSNYPNQIIKVLDLTYFATFHIYALINTGYSYVFGEDSIRYSFLTYQYGTMFFGEFDYTYFLQRNNYLRDIMQSILLFGLVFVVGFISYIMQLYKKDLLHKFLFATFFLNFVLILKFMLSFSVICNTDFRYFVPSFMLLALIFGDGLLLFRNIKWMWKTINVILVPLVVSEVLYFGMLLV